MNPTSTSVRRRASVAAILIAASLGASSVARADEGAQSAEPAPFAERAPYVRRNEEKSWYGWQTLVADGASILVVPAVAATTQSSGLGVVAVGGYLLAPPIIHAAHGRWGIAAASFGLRVGMPMAGLWLGSGADRDCKGELCIPTGAILGFALGALGAVALDASVLSFENVEPDAREAARRARPRTLAWSPSIAPRREGGVVVGLGATF